VIAASCSSGATPRPHQAGRTNSYPCLEEQKLIRSVRDRRVRKLYLMREDGSGRPFERAGGQERGFFKLSYAHFTDRIHHQLKLAGKATLLISLAQGPTFTLPTERADGWYGISANKLQRGIDELRGLDLIKVWPRAKKATRTRLGYTVEPLRPARPVRPRARDRGHAGHR
jgi:hypothetical protein